MNNKKEKPRLKKKYEDIVPKLKKEFGINNSLAVPCVEKIVVNIGSGEISKSKEVFERVRQDITAITGQVPQVRPAKASVASFNIRQGMPVGFKATLRGDRMFNFLDKIVSIVLPRLRDFRGVSLSSFDKHGNYSLGINEHGVFPEIDLAKSQNRGLEITIITNTKDKKESIRLLELLGMPFEKGN